MAKVRDFRLDEPTWQAASRTRREGWSVLLGELVHHGDFVAALDGRYLLASCTPGAMLFEALDEEGLVVHGARLAIDPLVTAIDEYAAIIDRLESGGQHRDSSWFHTIDMAKKVVHEKAALIVEREIALATDMATLRGIFSLVFSIQRDTSVLKHAHGH